MIDKIKYCFLEEYKDEAYFLVNKSDQQYEPCFLVSISAKEYRYLYQKEYILRMSEWNHVPSHVYAKADWEMKACEQQVGRNISELDRLYDNIRKAGWTLIPQSVWERAEKERKFNEELVEINNRPIFDF